MKRLEQNFGKWAIVTGASKGLGRAYFEQLLKLGFNVVGVARNTEEIAATQPIYNNQQIRCYNFDLSDLTNCHKLFEQTDDIDVALLINNAGFGVWGYFEETSLEKELNMIDLNIKALHTLTKLFLQRFEAQKVGRIINIGSVIAGNCPGPVFAGYYATKAYVWNLSNAINVELKKTQSPVRVIAICPGILKTNFWARSSNSDEIFSKTNVKTLPIDWFANKSLVKALKARYRSVIIVGWSNKMVRWASVHLPKWFFWTQLYKYQKAK